MTYDLKDGKIWADRCEVDVVHHCILSCRACNHMAPWADQYFADLDQTRRDLSILSRYYHSGVFGFSGGEALLHPRLPELMDVVRESGIADRLWVYTNGLLLGQMPAEFWEKLDTVRISLYPSTLKAVQLRASRKQARLQDVDLQVAYFPFFREPHSEPGTTDPKLVSRIYATCRIVHEARCHNVSEGYFYKCPRSMFIPRHLLGITGSEMARDAVRIADSVAFRDELLSLLRSDEPLAACRHCLGSVGKVFRHTQEPRRGSRPPRTTEELVDWGQLERLEGAPNLAPAPWLVRAKGMLSRLPPAVRLHPAFLRLAAGARDTFW